jgi:hypothetical protein
MRLSLLLLDSIWIKIKINSIRTNTDTLFIAEDGKFRIRIPYTFSPNQSWNGEIVSNSFIIQ